MAIRSKGSRSLVVDGHDYLWRIRKQPTDQQMCHGSPLLVAVQRVGCKARLVIELPHARPDAAIAPAAVAVTPRHVRAPTHPDPEHRNGERPGNH